MAVKTAEYKLRENATVTADGNTSAVSRKNVTKASIYINATLGGTTPSYNAFLQTQDACGNWHDVGSGVGAITASGTKKEVGITGPFGSAFRVREDVDVASADETYTGVDVSLVLEYEV